MKLRTISEGSDTIDARVYHKALLWPGTFIIVGALSVADAREMGFKAGNLTGDDTDRVEDAFARPHPLIVDMIEALPDNVWIDVLKYQSAQLSPNLDLKNIRIIDRGFDGYNMMYIEYLADVNLKLFYKSNDWSAKEVVDIINNGDGFKIVKNYET